MRIVTWNVNHRKGPAIWPRLQMSLAADIMLLQETTRPHSDGCVVWQSVPHAKWGSAVVAVKGRVTTIPIEGYEGWVVGGRLHENGWDAPGRSLFVFSVHAPTSNTARRRRDYVTEVASILKEIDQRLPSPADRDLIVGGDFNFCSLGERQKDETRKTTASEREALNRFAQLGLVSCWTAAHPGRPLAQTLRWSSGRPEARSIPFHCDGIFVPEAWQPGIICEVLTSASLEAASDHYPVAAWISK